MMKPYSIQAPEAIAKEYGGNKQKIAEAAKMGLVDPTAAVLAGMFIDRMRGAQAQEQAPKQTVAQQVFNSPQPALGGTPQAAQMQAMQQEYAPRPGARGMDRIPVDPNMVASAAGGGLVAFADGGRPIDRNALMQERTQLETALVPLRRQKQLGLKNVGPSLDAAEARLAEVNRLLAPGTYSDPKYMEEMKRKAVELGGVSGGPIPTDAVSLEEAYRGGNVDLGKPDLTNVTSVDPTKVDKTPTVRKQLTTVDSSGTIAALPGDGRDAATSYSGLAAIQNSGPVRTDEVMYGQPRTTATFDPYKIAAEDQQRKLAEAEKANVVTGGTTEVDKVVTAQQQKPTSEFTFTDDIDTKETLAAASKQIEDIIGGAKLGENEQAVLEYNKKAVDRIATELGKNKWATVTEIGFKLLASEDPNFMRSLGKAAQGEIPDALKRAKEIKKQEQEALDKSATYDAVLNDRKVKQLEASIGMYGSAADRELRKNITLLQEKQKFNLQRMSSDAQRDMLMLEIASRTDLQNARFAQESRENSLNRRMQGVEKALDRAFQSDLTDRDISYKVSAQDKQIAASIAAAQLERMFQGEQQQKRLENALAVVRMQIQAGSSEDRAREVFFNALKETSPGVSDAQLRAQAQQAVLDAKNAMQNGLTMQKMMMQFQGDVVTKSMEAWEKLFPNDPRKNNYNKALAAGKLDEAAKIQDDFLTQFENTFYSRMGGTYGVSSGSSSGVESYKDYTKDKAK